MQEEIQRGKHLEISKGHLQTKEGMKDENSLVLTSMMLMSMELTSTEMTSMLMSMVLTLVVLTSIGSWGVSSV